MMQLTLLRLCSKDDYTCGVLLKDGVFLCATLEDERREIKVPRETRIPSGEYEIKLRTEGGLTQKYQQKFPAIHRGMLHLQNVPNFKYIYIHIGNTDDDTEGCILVGNSIDYSTGFLGKSTDAYTEIYKIIAGALVSPEKVTIKIED